MARGFEARWWATQGDRARRLSRRARLRAHRWLLRYPAEVRCPICGWSGWRLASSWKPRRVNRMCPSCGSTERYRALELHLEQQAAASPRPRLLEVAPIGTVQATAERLGYDYTSVDLQSPRAAALGDLTALPFATGAFDVVICFHVLEHVRADVQAVEELARVVGPGGSALVIVPVDWKRPVTFEDPDGDPADNERLYGQSDHIRIYGADIDDRWSEADAEIDVRRWDDCFTPEAHRRAALAGGDDRFWIVRARSVDTPA